MLCLFGFESLFFFFYLACTFLAPISNLPLLAHVRPGSSLVVTRYCLMRISLVVCSLTCVSSLFVALACTLFCTFFSPPGLSLLCICFHLVSTISSLTCLSFFLLWLSCRHVCCYLGVLPLLHACLSCYPCVHPWLLVVFTCCTYLPRLTFSSYVVAPGCSADGMRVPASATCSSNFSFGANAPGLATGNALTSSRYPILISAPSASHDSAFKMQSVELVR